MMCDLLGVVDSASRFCSRSYKISKRKVQIGAEEGIVLKKKMVIVKATLFLR